MDETSCFKVEGQVKSLLEELLDWNKNKIFSLQLIDKAATVLEWHLTEGFDTLGSGSGASLTALGHDYFWLPVRRRQVLKKKTHSLLTHLKMLESTLIFTICKDNLTPSENAAKKIVICFFLWKKDFQVFMTRGLAYFEGTLEPVSNCFK